MKTLKAKVITRVRMDPAQAGAVLMRIDTQGGGTQAFVLAVETLRAISGVLAARPDLMIATAHAPFSPQGEIRTPLDTKPNWSYIGIPEQSPQGSWTVGHTTDGRVCLSWRGPSGLAADIVEKTSQMRLLAEALLQVCQAVETPTTDQLQ